MGCDSNYGHEPDPPKCQRCGSRLEIRAIEVFPGVHYGALCLECLRKFVVKNFGKASS